MADMYGALRSNEFWVKDVDAFRAWFDKFAFGDEIEFWIDEKGSGKVTKVSFGGEEQYPTAYPRFRDYLDSNEDGSPDEDSFFDLVEVPDLHAWATELREHLLPGEVFQVVAGGNEKLRYVGFTELIIAEDVDVPSFQAFYSDDNADSLRARMKGDSTV